MKKHQKTIAISFAVILVLVAGGLLLRRKYLEKLAIKEQEIAEKAKAANEGEKVEPPPPPAFVTNPETRPDALIVTKSLSSLPRDVLKQSILGDVLTKDFVFYYQESEGYLGLRGALKRIAFEHEETVLDEFLAYALNTPAEIALWKSYNGKLDDYMVTIERSPLTDVIAALAKIASQDSQLTKVSDRSVDGQTIPIYKLRYSATKELFVAAAENKLVIFSHPEMQLPTQNKLKSWTKATHPLGETQGPLTLGNLFEAQVPQTKHVLYASAGFLSFGYQRFFPGIDTIRFQFADQNGWSTQAVVQSTLMKDVANTNDLWQAIPRNPSLCAALPVDMKRVKDLKVFKDKESEANTTLDRIQSPVGICWYAKSKMYAPLLIAKVTGTIDRAFLHAAFEQMIGTLEAGILTDVEKEQYQDQQKRLAEGEKIEKPVKASKFEPAFAITEEQKTEGVILSRDVSSRFGIYDAEKSPNSAKMRSKKYFHVQMALWRDYLIFSADDTLVTDTIAVIDKKYPALADSLGSSTNTLFVVVPSELSELVKQTTFDSLPAEQESIFRESVSRRMLPALERLKKYAAISITLPRTQNNQWEEFKWQNISAN